MKRTRIIIASLLILALSACALTACGSSSASKSSSSTSNQIVTRAEGAYSKGVHHATVKVAGYEPFTIELNADAAPVTVANFCDLANKGYYNGLKFYRIVDGFVMQGGTKGDNAAGADDSLYPIIGEFSENDVKNPLAESFGRGTVAMARTGVYNSAKSTFFVTLQSTANVMKSLDKQYAAFGTIDEAGMQIVDAIVNSYLKYATGQSGAINEPEHMPVIEYIEVVD